MRQLLKLLTEAISEINTDHNMHLSIDVHSDEWCFIIHDNNKKIKIFGYTFDINDSAACEICRDKAICSEVLKKENIPSVYHKAFFTHDKFDDIRDYCEAIGYPVVVKQNDGGCGNNILFTNNIISLQKNVDTIFRKNNILSIAKYEEIKDEYRLLMINNHLELCYKKIRQHIVGDGVNTVQHLLDKFNIVPTVPLDTSMILSKGEVIVTNWQHNLSKGAKPQIVESINDDMLALAKQTTKILDLNVGCVDIIITQDNKMKVLEVNSGLMMDNFSQCEKTDYDYYSIAKNIYKKIILESLKR